MKKLYLLILVFVMASITVCSAETITATINIVGVRSKLLFENAVVYSHNKSIEFNVMVYTDLTEEEALAIVREKHGWTAASKAHANWLRNEAVGDAYVSNTGTYNEVIASMVNILAKQIDRNDIKVVVVERTANQQPTEK